MIFSIDPKWEKTKVRWIDPPAFKIFLNEDSDSLPAESDFSKYDPIEEQEVLSSKFSNFFFFCFLYLIPILNNTEQNVLYLKIC